MRIRVLLRHMRIVFFRVGIVGAASFLRSMTLRNPHGMADPSCNTNFLRAFFMVSVSSGSTLKSFLSTFEHCGATQFQSPSAVVYLLSCIRHI